MALTGYYISSITSSIPYIPSYLSSSPVKNDTTKQPAVLQPTPNPSSPVPPTNNSNNMTSSQQKSFWNTMFGSATQPTDKPPLFPDSPSLSHTPSTPPSSHSPPMPHSPSSSSSSSFSSTTSSPATNSPSLNATRPANVPLVQLATQSNMTSSRSYDSLVTLNPPSSSSSSAASSSSSASTTPTSVTTPTGNPDSSANTDTGKRERRTFDILNLIFIYLFIYSRRDTKESSIFS